PSDTSKSPPTAYCSSQLMQGTYLIWLNSEIVCFEATVKKIKKISKNLLTFIHVSVIINEQSRESD
ncbi:hypothetical protein DXA17_01175, partial [Ruminococcus sp. AM58-7XD]